MWNAQSRACLSLSPALGDRQTAWPCSDSSLPTLLLAQLTQGREDLELQEKGEKPVQSLGMLEAEAWTDS